MLKKKRKKKKKRNSSGATGLLLHCPCRRPLVFLSPSPQMIRRPCPLPRTRPLVSSPLYAASRVLSQSPSYAASAPRVSGCPPCPRRPRYAHLQLLRSTYPAEVWAPPTPTYDASSSLAASAQTTGGIIMGHCCHSRTCPFHCLCCNISEACGIMIGRQCHLQCELEIKLPVLVLLCTLPVC